MAKHKPSGCVAVCQCGQIIGAMDYKSTDRKDAGKLLGQWIYEGCAIQPRFGDSWSCTVTSCKCYQSAQQ